MRAHIDWLTFTLTPEYADETAKGYADAIKAAIYRQFGGDVAERVFGGDWQGAHHKRAPYQDAFTLKDGGISLYASPTLTHCTVEISGIGCEKLIRSECMDSVLLAIHERVTRIDIACDIETSVKPDEFVAQTKHERMRANGYQRSETGETAYVGSQKSDRYARVYRYYEPHPRAALLRVEHVFRRRYAKAVALAIVDKGIDLCASAAGEAFGWAHRDWKPAMGELPPIAVQAERKMGKTVFWLIKACAPAFRRMVQEGVITQPEQFVRQYFLVDV